MEVTALKGSSGDLQHFADRIFAERGVRYGRVAMISTSAKTKRRPKSYLTIETSVVACRSGSSTDLRTGLSHVRSSLSNGHANPALACPFGANNGSRAYSIISSQRASIFLRWSFGQPGLPQSFFVSQKVFGPPRAQHGFESGNT